MISREITLEEAARSFGTRHRVYKEYCSLVGKASVLENLEKSLDDIRIVHSTLFASKTKLPPELELRETIIDLSEKLEDLEGKGKNPIGME